MFPARKSMAAPPAVAVQRVRHAMEAMAILHPSIRFVLYDQNGAKIMRTTAVFYAQISEISPSY